MDEQELQDALRVALQERAASVTEEQLRRSVPERIGGRDHGRRMSGVLVAAAALLVVVGVVGAVLLVRPTNRPTTVPQPEPSTSVTGSTTSSIPLSTSPHPSTAADTASEVGMWQLVEIRVTLGAPSLSAVGDPDQGLTLGGAFEQTLTIDRQGRLTLQAMCGSYQGTVTRRGTQSAVEWPNGTDEHCPDPGARTFDDVFSGMATGPTALFLTGTSTLTLSAPSGDMQFRRVPDPTSAPPLPADVTGAWVLTSIRHGAATIAVPGQAVTYGTAGLIIAGSGSVRVVGTCDRLTGTAGAADGTVLLRVAKQNESEGFSCTGGDDWSTHYSDTMERLMTTQSAATVMASGAELGVVAGDTTLTFGRAVRQDDQPVGQWGLAQVTTAGGTLSPSEQFDTSFGGGTGIQAIVMINGYLNLFDGCSNTLTSIGPDDGRWDLRILSTETEDCLPNLASDAPQIRAALATVLQSNDLRVSVSGNTLTLTGSGGSVEYQQGR